MQTDSEATVEKKVDQNNYQQQDLISIKTKLDLPYYSGSAEYERAYGSMTIDGTSYQYVKRRVYKDTLELLCLPNDIKTKLQSIKNDLAISFTDGQASTPKKHSTIKVSLPDFFQPFKLFSTFCCTSQKPVFIQRSSQLFKGYRLKHKQPPKSSPYYC